MGSKDDNTVVGDTRTQCPDHPRTKSLEDSRTRYLEDSRAALLEILATEARESELSNVDGIDIEATEVLEHTRDEFEKAKGQDACFIMIRGPQQGGRFFLSRPEMIIGRDPTADVTIADASISRRHARVVHDKEANQTFLTDMGSVNGTVLNGKPIGKYNTRILEKEDMIRLGKSILKYLPAGEYEILTWGHMDMAAHTDLLTGISNRRYLTRALDAEFKRAKALRLDFSLLCLDIDHFKRFNDTYGHDAGDCVLKELTTLIRTRVLREENVLARYGGEEFVAILVDTDVEQALEVAERIRETVETHAFVYEGDRLPVTISVGLAQMTDLTESPSALYKAADKALYESKAAGRNRVTVSEGPS